ncbi:hypothetical protein [Streptomyces sp. LN704]|uniref:Cap15 family cyclic dinucleotide receptor domain-containing protein n=1 Tax=Streptomyces sp. LN704 TaxID=3112982 RepID=UPI00371EB408
MTSPAKSIRLGATGASTVYGIALYFSGLHPEQNLKHLLAYVPGVLGYLVVVFDKWAWRWPGIHRILGHPRLDGTWRVMITPSPESHIPVGGNRGPILAYLTIEQSYWTLHTTLRTAESSSRSTSATIEKTNGSGVSELRYLYENNPQAAHQARSPRHIGACRIELVGRTPTSLTGGYYTDRFTAGDLELTLVNRATDHATYAQSAAADSSTAASVG